MAKCWSHCGGNKVCCYDCNTGATCFNAVLLQDINSPIHDQELDEASKKINQILVEVRSHNQDPERELAFLAIPEEQSDGTVLLLAWVSSGVSADSSVDDIRKVLL